MKNRLLLYNSVLCIANAVWDDSVTIKICTQDVYECSFLLIRAFIVCLLTEEGF